MRVIHLAAACFLALLVLTGCTDEAQSRDALERAGFDPLSVGGYAWAVCGKGDSFATRFVARNPRGQDVAGVVCCGLLKGCTIRFD